MLKSLRIAAAFLAVIVLASCGPKMMPPNLTPSEQTAYKRDYLANEAVVLMGSLQHTAIELNKVMVCPSPEPTSCHLALSEPNTRIVVKSVTGSLKVIEAVPAGWKAATDVALSQIEDELDVAGKAKLTPYVQAARAALAALPQQN